MSIISGDGFFSTGTDLGVSCVHLISGEDIIGKAFKTADGYTVEQAVMPNVQFDGQRYQVTLMHYRPFIDADAKFDFRDKDVMFVQPVNKQMQGLYTQFTSNISLVGAGALPKL